MNQRILIIAPRFPVSEDRIIATWALNQAKALRRSGAAVEVISPSPYVPRVVGEMFGYERWSDLDRQQVFDDIKVFYPSVPVYNTEKLRDAYDRLPQLETEPFWAFCKEMVYERIEVFDPDVLFCHHPLPSGRIGMEVCTRENIPYLIVEHSLTDIKRASKNHRRRELYTKIANDSAAFITVSQMMKRQIRNSLSREFKIDIIYNGYDPKEVELEYNETESKDRGNQLHILSVGSFIERKGHKYLVKALGQLKDQGQTDIYCTFVGSGPLETEVKTLINSQELGSLVEIRSGLTREELNRLMASADLFALPSWDEPCAVVYPEVMAHGVPTIMCGNQGFSELIKNKKTGYLVPPRNTTAIVEILSEAVSNRAQLQQVGRQGQQMVESKLTWDDNARNVRRLIDQRI